MPPWGAVKGFGEFKNDQALTPEQLEIIGAWVDGGAPEGEDKDLPPPPKFPPAAPDAEIDRRPGGERRAPVDQRFYAGRLAAAQGSRERAISDLAETPDGRDIPLLWMFPFKPIYAHPFLLKKPLTLPKGTIHSRNSLRCGDRAAAFGRLTARRVSLARSFPRRFAFVM